MCEYAYCRVSTVNQNEDRQLIAMQEVNVPTGNVFVDKQSGKDFDRPKYRRLMRIVRQGDVIYVKSIDRLGRNYKDILEQWKLITKDKGVDLVILDMPLLDTRKNKDLIGTFLSDVVLALLSYVSENERVNIHQRQAEGIAAAKARGVRFGRPVKIPPADFQKLVKRWESGKMKLDEVLEHCRMSESTFYRRLRELRSGG